MKYDNIDLEPCRKDALMKDLFNKFLKYSFVGCICTIIYFISVFFLVELLSQNPLMGSAIAFIIMTCFSFVLNKKFTFGGHFSQQKLIRFFIVATIGFILNYFIIFSIVNILSLHYAIGEFITILVIPLVNFTLNNYWTFRTE
jgi:putative flippase GtrA